MIAAACINNAGKNKLVNDGSAPLPPLTVVTTRPPLPGDAAAVAQLVRQTETLEPNSTYAYLLLCTHFAETSVVAESGGALVGCALGYRVPSRPHTLFIWQIGVHPTAQRRGVALRLLDDLMRRPALRDVTH